MNIMKKITYYININWRKYIKMNCKSQSNLGCKEFQYLKQIAKMYINGI